MMMDSKYKNEKTYLLNHERKGRFTMLVLKQDDTWIHGVIVAGSAGSYLDYHTRDLGEEVAVRKSLIRSHNEVEQ